MSRPVLDIARAEALFASPLPVGDYDLPTLRAAVTTTVRVRGGVNGCAEVMAQAYGDHPEQAAKRMRWARNAAAPRAPRRKAKPSQPGGGGARAYL